MDQQERLKPFKIRHLHHEEALSDVNRSPYRLAALSAELSRSQSIPHSAPSNEPKGKVDGVISLRKKSYDDIIQKQPNAALTYLDDDDGETIRVRLGVPIVLLKCAKSRQEPGLIIYGRLAPALNSANAWTSALLMGL